MGIKKLANQTYVRYYIKYKEVSKIKTISVVIINYKMKEGYER